MAFSDTFDQVKKWCLGVNSVDEAQQGIRRDVMLQQGLKTWSHRVGWCLGIAGGLCVLGAAGIFIVPTMVTAGLFGGIKLAQYLVKRDIEHKREAEEQIQAQEQLTQAAAKAARQPAPKLNAKAMGAFNAKASEPANDTSLASSASRFLKRFKMGS
jgi:hypothetical protein